MSKEDKPPPSPNHGLFDPTHLFGSPSLGLAAAGLPFPHLAHLPAYPWLARPAFPPALFGGLGALPSPLLTHGLPPSSHADFGGADWWRAASEHARRGDLFMSNLGPSLVPSLDTLSLESSTPGLEFLLTAPSDGDKSALFNMSKHLTEIPSTSSSSKRSRTPTPAPAHQKSSTKTSTSTTSSSSSKDLHLSYPPFSLDGKDPWHLNGSAFSLNSLTSKHEASRSRKRRHKEEGSSSSRESKASKMSSVQPAHLSSVSSGSSSVKELRREKEVEENGVLNLSKSAPSATVTSPLPPPPITPGVEDLSMKKSDKDKESKTTTVNGTTVSGSVSPAVSSPGTDSDNSDVGNQSESEKDGDKLTPHQIDGSRKQLLADQIRQHILADVLSPSSGSHQTTPLVIPSLRVRASKEDAESKKAGNLPPLSLINFAHDYPRPENLLLERDLLGLPSTSAALHTTSPHVAAAFSFLPAELRPNHHSKEESQDSLLSLHTSEADDKPTSGSDRLMDSESPSGWGSEDDASRNMASSSASPGPSYSEDPSKRRNVVLNEKELLIPLEHGWRRQTTIHGMGRRGIVGEVLYFAPCNKKMKTIPDVMRYLDRHAITDLSRENFTFNTKVNVGQFYEIRDKQVVRLTEVEILERIAMSKGKRARMQMLAKKKCEKQLRQQALAKQLMEAKFKKRQEQQEMARKAAEMRYQMRLEKEQQKEMAKKAKQVRLIERQREKERSRIMKQQEKVRLQEQLRVEREMKAQQILEARRRRQTELEEMRLKEIARKNQEREMKKQQQILEKEQEKERRRQHFLLVKALEQRKKEEERLEKERQREERIRKQNIERERKLAQRQIEMLIAREMKKPMDDMELRNGKPIPKYPRCSEAKLPGPAFSDSLMVVEFVHNFADALGLDSESLPSLEVFQNGLLNTNEEDVEEVVTLYLHLLRFALDDLGVPNPKSAMTALNQKITDLEITDATMSEVTRLFLFAHGEKEMSQWLEEIPLEALNATKKAAIIAFLCNELLSSKRLSGEIERTLESINTLRRDKWIVEGKLRKLRTVRARKFLKLEFMGPTPQPTADEDSMTNTTNNSSKAVSDEEEEKEEEEEEKEEEEEMESFDDNSTTGNRSEDEDEGLSKEEMDKKIDKLSKQHNSFDSKVADVSKQLRGTCLGQDRFKRFYWILPYTGGIFVEGIESGDTEARPIEVELLARQKAKEEEEERLRAEEAASVKTEEKEIQAATQESDKAQEATVKEEEEEEKVTKVTSILDASVTVKEETCEKMHSDPSDSIPKENVGEGDVREKNDQVLTSATRECDSFPRRNTKTVNASTQENSVNILATVGCTALAAAQDRGSTVQDRGTTTENTNGTSVSDLAKKLGAAGLASAHQEPILCKLNDLLRLPHLTDYQTSSPDLSLQPQKVSPQLENGAGKAAATAASAAAVSSSSSSMLSSSSLLSPSSAVSAPSAVTLTMSSLSTMLTVTTATTVSSTPSYPSPLLTLSSSSASSTLSSLAAAAATGSCELNPLGPMMTPATVAHSLSSASTTVPSSTPVSSPLSVSVTSATSMPVSVLSPLKTSASKSLLTVSLLSPEFSTTKPGEHSPSLTAASTPKPCLLSPTVRKTLSSAATTVLSSTPLSMLAAMSKVTTLSPSSSAVSVSAENGPLLQLSSTLVVPSYASSSSLLASSRTVSLLNSTPVTSPILSVSSSPMKDKKSNFVSIDALLKRDTQSSLSPSSSSSTTTATVSTSTPISSSGNSNKHFLNPSLFPPSPLISDHNLKSYVDILDQKPWFSILPRIPCDEVSLTLPKVATSTSVPGLGVVSSDNIASASLSLLSLLPMQQQLEEQKTTTTTTTSLSQSQTSPAHTQTESQTKAMLDFSSAFQAHLSQSSLEDISMTMSTATNTSDLSLCTDAFKVPAPPSDSSYLSSEVLLNFDPAAQLMKIQGECLPVPLNKQLGWWKIEDAQQVRQLYTCLLNRGIREKNLSHMLRKHMEVICTQVCKVDTGKIIKQEIEEKPTQATVAVTEESVNSSLQSPATSNKVTVATETEDPSFLLKHEIKTESEEPSETKDHNASVKTEEKEREAKDDEEEKDDAILKEPEDSWNLRVRFDVEMACLEDVEALEDRIFNASLQVKVWKLPQRASEDPEIHMVDRSVQDPKRPQFYPMDVARHRLLLLEGNVERRYLKPPLIRNVQLNLATLGTERASESRNGERSSSDGKSQEEEEEWGGGGGSEMPSVDSNEDVPPGLMLWRRAVRTACTPAQLNLCTQLLGNSIAWEKSIMKVTCQICMKDDNEAELLLCDGCDRGYHTYCFKPKMEDIPDGDWYCYECVSKVSGKSHCIVCGGQGGKIVECERCPRAIHTDCLDPPLPRMPKKWQCAICIQTKSKKSCKRKRKEPPPSQTTPVTSNGRERKDSATITTRDRRASETTAESPTPSPEKKKKEAAKEKKEKPLKEEKKKDEKAKEEKKKVEKPKKKVEEKEKSEPKEKKPKEKKSKKKKEEEAALLDPTNKDPDMVLCAKLLLDLEQSEDGWPFLRPVSSKQFPSYRRYIKQPMDFTTMKHKLRDNMYKERSEVATDLKLIWANCETFNEDDSEVGQAGHNLHRLFLHKWKELFPDDVL